MLSRISVSHRVVPFRMRRSHHQTEGQVVLPEMLAGSQKEVNERPRAVVMVILFLTHHSTSSCVHFSIAQSTIKSTSIKHNHTHTQLHKYL